MNERDIAWFRPLWIRLVVTGVVVGWFGFEALYSHDQFWMAISGIGIAYCIWNFFIRWPKDLPPSEPPPPSST